MLNCVFFNETWSQYCELDVYVDAWNSTSPMRWLKKKKDFGKCALHATLMNETDKNVFMVDMIFLYINVYIHVIIPGFKPYK